MLPGTPISLSAHLYFTWHPHIPQHLPCGAWLSGAGSERHQAHARPGVDSGRPLSPTARASQCVSVCATGVRGEWSKGRGAPHPDVQALSLGKSCGLCGFPPVFLSGTSVSVTQAPPPRSHKSEQGRFTARLASVRPDGLAGLLFPRSAPSWQGHQLRGPTSGCGRPLALLPPRLQSAFPWGRPRGRPSPRCHLLCSDGSLASCLGLRAPGVGTAGRRVTDRILLSLRPCCKAAPCAPIIPLPGLPSLHPRLTLVKSLGMIPYNLHHSLGAQLACSRAPFGHRNLRID